MLEIMMGSIQYEQAVSIMNTLSDLLDFEVTQQSGKTRKLPMDITQEKVANSFISYSVNPLKTAVMLIYVADQIEKKYLMLALFRSATL